MSSSTTLIYRIVWCLALLALPTVYQKPPSVLPSEILSAINNAESIGLYALDAYTRDNDLEHFNEQEMSATKFHGQTIFGSHLFSDDASKARIRNAITDSTPAGVMPAACFWPRHGVRFKNGSELIDLVICFQCNQMRIYTPHGDSSVTVTSAGKATLDRLLTHRGISNPS